MKVILHIGWNRTGSTALQVFLLRNAKALVQRCGTYYPREGLLADAHHNLAWTFRGKTTSPWGEVPAIEGGGDAYVRAAVDSARSQGCTRIIFSSEGFYGLDLAAIRQLSESLRARADSVQIVAYIRRQDRFAESAYNMDVKWWATRLTAEFDEYIRNLSTPPDYFRDLSRWAGVFGSDNLVVRRYERDALEGRDVRIDFCKAIGLSPEALGPMEADSNDSLGPKTLEMMRVLNNLDIPNEVHGRIATGLRAYDVKNRSPRSVLFDPGPRRAYMATVEQSNRELVAFGIDPGALAVGDEAGGERNVRRLTAEQFTALFSYLAGNG